MSELRIPTDVGEFTVRALSAGLEVEYRTCGTKHTLHIPYPRLAALCVLGLPKPCRWGLVIDGELQERDVSEDERHILDRAAECRLEGLAATVVKLPVGKV